ncbi:sterol 24-C-methyltransferase [Entomortierella parvispora]|uniref:Sterol 24-C-methyltransferase n=1 Tax=Entomortierella parvispora TaxID=205924 RepID=A0A9P3H1L9_9FUNG|nr:sterol 24-C-methyltransferase [Entomortierella parvispora]
MSPPTKGSSTATATAQPVHAQDLERSKLLHGKTWEEKQHQDSFLSKLKSKNREFLPEVVNQYMVNWQNNTSPDQESDKDVVRKGTDITNLYFELSTDFYEYAWGTSWHFCRFHHGEPVPQAMARYEHYLAARAGITANQRVLDIGCGVGGPAREIAHFTGAHITGININDYQISRARRYAVVHGLQNKQEFVKGDFMKMPLENNTFDACYAIEATPHASSLKGVYAEAYRVLKPGGVFACYEWVLTDKYEPANPEHQRIAKGIKLGCSLVNLVTVQETLDALTSAGFEIEEYEDRAVNDDPIPWYYPLSGELRYARTPYDYFTIFRSSTYGRIMTNTFCAALEKVGILAAGSTQVAKFLDVGATSLAESGKLGIYTPMFFFVARKPLA